MRSPSASWGAFPGKEEAFVVWVARKLSATLRVHPRLSTQGTPHHHLVQMDTTAQQPYPFPIASWAPKAPQRPPSPGQSPLGTKGLWPCHQYQQLPAASLPRLHPHRPPPLAQELSSHSPATGPCQWPHSPELRARGCRACVPQRLHGEHTVQAVWHLLRGAIPRVPPREPASSSGHTTWHVTLPSPAQAHSGTRMSGWRLTLLSSLTGTEAFSHALAF